MNTGCWGRFITVVIISVAFAGVPQSIRFVCIVITLLPFRVSLCLKFQTVSYDGVRSTGRNFRSASNFKLCPMMRFDILAEISGLVCLLQTIF